MSAPEQERQQGEQRSSVKIKDLWKGEDPAVAVSAAEGVSEDEMTRLRELAVANYLAAKTEVAA